MKLRCSIKFSSEEVSPEELVNELKKVVKDVENSSRKGAKRSGKAKKPPTKRRKKNDDEEDEEDAEEDD